MSNVANLPLVADRYGACVRQIHIEGLDLTGLSMRAQVRFGGDVPGAPLVDLLTVTNGNAEGLRLVDVVRNAAGVPQSHVELVINESTMKALPYMGETGDAASLAWDWQVTIAGRKRRIAKGGFTVLGDGVTGADSAPVNRPAGFGRGRPQVGETWQSARLTFGEETVTIRVDGADLIAPLVRQAEAARDAVKPLFGAGPPAAGAGIAGSVYYDTTDPIALIMYGPKTSSGWGIGRGLKGQPGGNVLSVGLFSEASGFDIPAAPAGTDRIRTSGYDRVGVGAADYVYDPAINAANLISYPGWARLRTGGGGFKLSADQPLSLSMFGWKTDFVSASQRGTDNAPVLARLKSFLSAVADARSSIYRYTPEIQVPVGRAYTTASLNFDYGTVGLVGVRQGVTDSDGLGGSVIITAERLSGTITNSADTSGENSRPLSFGSTGSYITGITMLSLGGQPGDAADGFRARGQTTYTDCIAIGYPRHGFNLSADLSGQGGNVNASSVMTCTAVRNYLDGFFFSGGDGNAISVINPNARYNGRCGINFNQFLANTQFSCHLEANGTNDSGPRSMPQQLGAQCYYNGRYYAIYPGRAADAANSTPDAGVAVGVWVDRGPGVPHPVYPTYQAGMAWTEGSAMRITGANAQTISVGGYAEPGQPPVFVGGGGGQFMGQMDAGVIGSKAYMYVSGGMFTAAAFQVISGTETTQLGGEPENRLFQRYRTAGFFSWDARGSASGDFNFVGGNTGGPVWSARQSDNQMRIAKPLLASVRVESAVNPVAVGTVSKLIPVFDASGTELGLIEVKARA